MPKDETTHCLARTPIDALQIDKPTLPRAPTKPTVHAMLSHNASWTQVEGAKATPISLLKRANSPPKWRAPSRFDNFPESVAASAIKDADVIDLELTSPGSSSASSSEGTVSLAESHFDTDWSASTYVAGTEEDATVLLPLTLVPHGTLPDARTVAHPPSARYDADFALVRVADLLERERKAPSAHWHQHKLTLGIPETERRLVIQQILDLNYNYFDEVAIFPAEARWLASKFFSLFVADYSFIDFSVEFRHQYLSHLMLICFNLAIKICIDACKPLYRGDMNSIIRKLAKSERPSQEYMFRFETAVLRAPTIDYRLYTPTPWNYIEEFAFALPTLKMIAEVDFANWDPINDRLQKELARQISHHGFLRYSCGMLAAVALYVAVEEVLKPKSLDPVGPFATHHIRLSKLQDELVATLRVSEADFLVCLTFHYNL